MYIQYNPKKTSIISLILLLLILISYGCSEKDETRENNSIKPKSAIRLYEFGPEHNSKIGPENDISTMTINARHIIDNDEIIEEIMIGDNRIPAKNCREWLKVYEQVISVRL
ncbi:MAG: hypothetical protein JEZ07_16030 [Phycisphaerae bacterium]|nr:hypothetical protein [Phycisphaerae bacterium]